MKTLANDTGLNIEEILKGFIVEMNNYGYIEFFIGKYLAKIVYILENPEGEK